MKIQIDMDIYVLYICRIILIGMGIYLDADI